MSWRARRRAGEPPCGVGRRPSTRRRPSGPGRHGRGRGCGDRKHRHLGQGWDRSATVSALMTWTARPGRPNSSPGVTFPAVTSSPPPTGSSIPGSGDGSPHTPERSSPRSPAVTSRHCRIPRKRPRRSGRKRRAACRDPAGSRGDPATQPAGREGREQAAEGAGDEAGAVVLGEGQPPGAVPDANAIVTGCVGELNSWAVGPDSTTCPSDITITAFVRSVTSRRS